MAAELATAFKWPMGTPHSAQPVAQLLDRHDQRGKCRCGLRRQIGQACAIFSQYGFERRAGVGRVDLVERGKFIDLQ
jgi:hypothetical protein